MSAVARTVDEYIAALPDDARAVMETLRAAIRAAAPKATESISYQIPTFSYRGPLVAIAAWKRHCGMYPMSNAVIAACGDALKPYKAAGAKSTIHFALDKPPPVALVKKIVRARLKENEARGKQ